MSGGFTKEQLEAAKQLREGYRSKGTFRSQTTAGTGNSRPRDGLIRPIPVRSFDNEESTGPESGNSSPVLSKYVVSQPIPIPGAEANPHHKARARAVRHDQEQMSPATRTTQPSPLDRPSVVPSIRTFAGAGDGACAPKAARAPQSAVNPGCKTPSTLLFLGNNSISADTNPKSKPNEAPPVEDVWKPVVCYYSEEPTKKPATPDFVKRELQRTKEELVKIQLQMSGYKEDDLIDLTAPPFVNTDIPDECQRSKNIDRLVNALGKTMSIDSDDPEQDVDKNKGKAPSVQDEKGELAPLAKPFIPARAPKGLREAIEINESGKPIVWVYSDGTPRPREVTEEETRGISLPAEPDSAPSEPRKFWTRPERMQAPALIAKAAQKAAAASAATSAAVVASAPALQQDRGLGASRHSR